MAGATTSATPMATVWPGERRRNPIWMTSDWLTAYRRTREPAIRKIVSRISRPRPTVINDTAIVPLPRNGRNRPKWASTANMAVANMPHAAATTRF